LTEVEDIFHEETSAICDLIRGVASATCAHNTPTVASIGTPVPEQHPRMTAMLKHLKPHKMPSATQALVGLTITPAMQTIVVDRVPIVDPQVATIIRDNAESVIARPEDSHAASPTHSEVVASTKAGPSAACVFIVHVVFPAGHIRSSTLEVLATAALTEVKSVFPEEPMAIGNRIVFHTSATGPNDSPSVASVRTSVPEQHPSMTTLFKHLEPHKTPATTKALVGLPIAPAMQAIVVDRVSIVNPQLAAIIRDNAKSVMACPEDSQAACPTYSKVIFSGKPSPFATCVAVVHVVFPTSHVRPPSVQVLTATTLTKVESVLPE